jgi:hypothetical protein
MFRKNIQQAKKVTILDIDLVKFKEGAEEILKSLARSFPSCSDISFESIHIMPPIGYDSRVHLGIIFFLTEEKLIRVNNESMFQITNDGLKLISGNSALDELDGIMSTPRSTTVSFSDYS